MRFIKLLWHSPTPTHARWATIRVVEVIAAHDSCESVWVGQHVGNSQFVVVRVLVGDDLSCFLTSTSNDTQRVIVLECWEFITPESLQRTVIRFLPILTSTINKIIHTITPIKT